MEKVNLKVKHKEHFMKYTDCYFIKNIDDYKEYFELLNNKFTVSESEIKNNKTFIGHGHSFLTGVSGMFSGMIEDKTKREPMLANLKLLYGQVVCDQLKHILEGDKIVVNKVGGYFPIKKDTEYIIIGQSDVKHTEKDIKVNKWWGGKHYYAKIGNIDVVDERGNVKWNTEKEAYRQALKYLNK